MAGKGVNKKLVTIQELYEGQRRTENKVDSLTRKVDRMGTMMDTMMKVFGGDSGVEKSISTKKAVEKSTSTKKHPDVPPPPGFDLEAETGCPVRKAGGLVKEPAIATEVNSSPKKKKYPDVPSPPRFELEAETSSPVRKAAGGHAKETAIAAKEAAIAAKDAAGVVAAKDAAGILADKEAADLVADKEAVAADKEAVVADKEAVVADEEASGVAAKGKGPYNCKICRTQQPELKKHYFETHLQKKEETEDGKSVWICNECERENKRKQFDVKVKKDEETMIKHLRQHFKPDDWGTSFVCKEKGCSKEFGEGGLFNHITTEHGEKCTGCNQKVLPANKKRHDEKCRKNAKVRKGG